MMEYLWAPWRFKYFTDPPVEGCLFCWAASQKEDSLENLVVYRGQHAYVMLNKYPYTSGHLMVVPYAHIATLSELAQTVRCEMMDIAAQAMEVLQQLYSPNAFNVGFNMGKAAGAGIVDHLHMHVVPRWYGDTNFMTTISQARVLPEGLDVTFEKVRNQWQKLAQSGQEG